MSPRPDDPGRWAAPTEVDPATLAAEAAYARGWDEGYAAAEAALHAADGAASAATSAVPAPRAVSPSPWAAIPEIAAWQGRATRAEERTRQARADVARLRAMVDELAYIQMGASSVRYCRYCGRRRGFGHTTDPRTGGPCPVGADLARAGEPVEGEAP